ncbi:MAG: hypothetical protein DWQ37_08405 [Planctomycetota bacterium]|mgnify:CR=1 FL=1|nr:MAG: hypothetical protein DWQ37_08405 [Planctomycetota bacterium]
MGPLATTLEGLVSGPWAALWYALLALIALGAQLRRRPWLTGTTLVAPWWWSLVALAALVGSEVLIALAEDPAPEWSAPLRLAAAMSTFLPAMALLGAKRPQDRGWQLIVLSLWGILALPSIEWMLFGGQTELHPARFWFLVILIFVGATNGLGTRHWPTSFAYCVGQILLLTSLFSSPPLAWGPLAGIAAIVVAWLLETLRWRRDARANLPLNRVWLDFRDAFGVVWALRIMERMNASTRMYHWPVALGWTGFHAVEGDAVTDIPPAVEESLRTLLRRFVSPEWIDARLADAAPTASSRVPLGS